MTETFDVVIVGCGTVGEYLSLALGAAGHRVAVVERWPQVYPLPRAVHFDDEVARLFRTVGLDARTSPVVEPYDDVYRWVDAGKEVLLDLDWTGTGPSGWPAASFFSQPELDRELVAAMEKLPDVTLLRGWEVQDLAEDEDGVTVTARSMRPEEAGALATRTVRGRYVVGADGANSFVRRWTKARMHDLGFTFDWLIVDMIPDEPMRFDPPAWQWCDPAGPTTVVPGGPGRRRWEFMRLPHETVEELSTVETAWQRMAAWGLTPENSVLERHAVYTFRATWVRPEHWRSGRVLLAGDAAHLAPPFAGQGLGAGIRDAQNLAWKLDAVLAGRATDELLDTYGPERCADVERWVTYAVALGEIICVLDPEAAAVRDARMKAAGPGGAPAPPPRALTAGVIGSHHAAGRLSHQYRVRRGDVVDLFDQVVGPGWAVISRAGSPAAALGPENLAWAERNGVALVRVGAEGSDADLVDVDGGYRAWLAGLGADTVVVRPDFYLYDAGPLLGLDAAVTALRAVLHATRTSPVR